MGVENIITFDAHDPRVQNAIPGKGFETVQPSPEEIISSTMITSLPSTLLPKNSWATIGFLPSTIFVFTNGLEGFDKFYKL